jgi:hypothetical protein
MPRRLVLNLLSPSRTRFDRDPVVDVYLQSQRIEIEYPLISKYHCFSQLGCTNPIFFDASIGTIGTTRFRGVIRHEGCVRHLWRSPCPRPHRRSNIRVSDQAVRRALSGEPKRGRND